MTEKARLCSRARSRWPLLALLIMLAPTLGGAVPPLDTSLPSDSPLKLREGLPSDTFSSATAQRTHAGSGKNPIGRIFFSPAERRRRSEDKAPGADAPSSAHAVRGNQLEINGAVSSSTQGRAVWVNGTAIENSAKLKSAWTDRAGNIWLRDERGTPRLVRPGQAIDPASGVIEDLLPAGSVARR